MTNKIKKQIKRRLRNQARAAAKSAIHVANATLHGEDPKAALQREIQSKVDRALHKAVDSKVNGRGAYGRGAYGRGAYDRSNRLPASNSLFTDSKLQRSSFKSIGDETGRIVVSRREYVTRVVSPATPSDFSVTSYNINPGLSGVFAWLSQIACNFEEYEFYGLVFSYQPVISTATTTGAMGSVVVACNYNAGAPKFQSFREMVEYQGAIESRICDPIDFGIECDPSKNAGHDMEYIRAGAVPSGEDIKSYDIGTFQMATSDVSAAAYPSGTLLGHVYVEYSVRLGKPKLFTALGKNIMSDLIRGNVRCTDTLPFGEDPLNAVENTLGGIMSSSGSSVYTFPSNFSGTVVVKVFCDSSVADDDAITMLDGGQIDQLKITGYNGDAWSENAYVTDSMVFKVYQVGQQLGSTPNTLTITARHGTGTFNGSTLCVTVVNPDVFKPSINWVSNA